MTQKRRRFFGLRFVAVMLVLVIIGLLGLLFVFKPQSSAAAAYYVNPATGSDDAFGTEKNAPFRTIQRALETAQPGDVIHLADGTYNQSARTVRSGEQNHPITIQGTREAVMRGSSSRIFEVNHDYITLAGFRIDGKNGDSKDQVRDKLIYAIGTSPQDGVEGLVVHDMLLENAGGECMRLRYFAKNNEIRNSTIRHCGLFDYVFNDGGKNGEGIYIGTAPEQLADGKNPTNEPDVSTGNWVHHNLIETHGNECVDIKESSHDNLAEYNTCRYQKDPESAGLDARGDANTFRYNTVEQTVGAGIRLGGDKETDGVRNNAYENHFAHTSGGMFKVTRQPQGTICGNEAGADVGRPSNTSEIDPAAPCE